MIFLIVFCAVSICAAWPPQEVQSCGSGVTHLSETEGAAKLEEFASTYSTLAEWQERAGTVRQGILAGMNFDPMPHKASLRAVVHSKKDYDGYSVESAFFESFPGFFVTGNLYRPQAGDGPFPGILCPHGHWSNLNNLGRFRESLQMRCATLARMGCVVFSYDMVGYGESDQIVHCFMEGNVALQTWNSIRGVDFLLSLGYVDTARIGITGASGGGTQSFLATALDPRIAVSVPVCQVSAHFYGGCNCESGMPIHNSDSHETVNADIAALAAPRPQLLVSNGDDWTSNTPDVEYPYIRNVYLLYDAADNVENLHLANEVHDYGPSKRQGMYAFFAKHFGLTALDEGANSVLSMEDLRVFTPENPRPDYALSSQQEVLDGLFFKGTYGCADTNFIEYDPDADLYLDDMCVTPRPFGCTDSGYMEYNPDAIHVPDSCKTVGLSAYFAVRPALRIHGRTVTVYHPGQHDLEVLSLQGKVLFSSKGSETRSYTVPVSGFGVYLIRLKTARGITEVKAWLP
jgi:dienelactone hydrolase